jgi:hypothetical protein
LHCDPLCQKSFTVFRKGIMSESLELIIVHNFAAGNVLTARNTPQPAALLTKVVVLYRIGGKQPKA